MRTPIVLCLYLLCSLPALAATIHVPKDYSTIQQAIDAAKKGDTVLVDPGTYVENIIFKGKAVLVQSVQGPANTFIDGNAAGSVVTFSNDEGLDSVLDGFTVTNGDAVDGGGIHCFWSTPTIVNNHISLNTAEKGGGVFCKGSAAVIQDNIVEANKAVHGGGIYCEGAGPVISGCTFTKNRNCEWGGGVCCYGSSPAITNNTFQENEAENGGAISCQLFCSPAITGNTFHHNVGTGGGAIKCDSSSPNIGKNEFYSNTANKGGGINCLYNSSPFIEENTIYENSALYGGGIFGGGYSSPVISKNTIYKNHANMNGGGIEAGDDALVTENIIYENDASLGGGIYGYDEATLSKNFIYNNKAFKGGGIYAFKVKTITQNIVTGNKAGYGAGIMCHMGKAVIVENLVAMNKANYFGGGLFFELTDSQITNNLVIDNSANAGGGISIDIDAHATVMNNTVCINSAGEAGGGIYCRFNANVQTWNTILYDNEAPKAPEIRLAGDSILLISHCDVKGGAASVTAGANATLDWGSNMIDGDPRFADPGQMDYHLTWTSPCINCGTNEGAPLMDMDGEIRPWMGAVDIGVDEFTGTHSLEAYAFTISGSVGGSVKLYLDGGAGNGLRGYVLFSSLSGTGPGIPLPHAGKPLPVNWDSFTKLGLQLLNTPFFQNFQGVLDAGGGATAKFDTQGPVPGAAGLSMTFAYALESPWDFASNPIILEIVP